MLELRLGLSARPHTQALLDGTVEPEGVRLVWIEEFGDGVRNRGTARHRAIVSGELDGGEFSTSSLFLAHQRGARLVALPVFIARGFCHGAMYCHTAAPIQTPSDLRGKKVTVHRYNNTVAVWMRALLASDYGVAAHDVEWYVAEDDLEGEPAANGVSVHRIPEPSGPQHVVEMLARGDLDAGLEQYLRPQTGIRHIVADHRAVEADYYRRAGVLPIYHTLVLRTQLLNEHPWLARSLLDAFRAARGLAPSYYSQADRAEAFWYEAVLDEDPFAHHLGSCERRTLDELGRLLLAEGLLKKPIATETLFACAG
jgi:4,5-dihydroxyphthalate decarboxylase